MLPDRHEPSIGDDELNAFRAHLLFLLIITGRGLWQGSQSPENKESPLARLFSTNKANLEKKNDEVSVYRSTLRSITRFFSSETRGYIISISPVISSIDRAIEPCNQFIAACAYASGEHVKPFLRMSCPFEVQLWQAFHEINQNKGYGKLDALLMSTDLMLCFQLHKVSRTSLKIAAADNIDLLDAIINSRSIGLDLFVMLDLLRNRLIEPRVRDSHMRDWEDLLVVADRMICRWSQTSPQLFLSMFGRVDDILKAFTIEHYNKYKYDKSGENLEDAHVQKCISPGIDKLCNTIMSSVSRPYYMGKIFKTPDDICKMMSFLKQTQSEKWRPERMVDTFSKIMEAHILSNKSLMKEIASSPLRDQLFAYFPDIVDPCTEAASYKHAALGLLTAQQTREHVYLNRLPKDLVKKIARMTEDAVKEEQKGHGKNNPG